MKLPNGDRAVVDISKLRDYCLSADHPRGRHKARVFASALGSTAKDAADLQKALLEAARAADASASDRDQYGQRYVVEFIMTGPAGTAAVRSAWIVRADEDFPRLTSCHVI
jgi:hypothetical protein